MRTEISEVGVMKICPENSTEAFALVCWGEQNIVNGAIRPGFVWLDFSGFPGKLQPHLTEINT